jgi:hypothetical protein
MADLFEGWGPCGIEVEDANYELYLATSQDVVRTHGKYFVYNKERRMPSVVYDAQKRKRLWRILEEQTGARYPA